MAAAAVSRAPAPRRRWLAACAIAGLAALGLWLYENASIPRLRAEFEPLMHRLERYRDALETTRAALRSHGARAGEPDGIAELRLWAWESLDRIAGVSFDVAGQPGIPRAPPGPGASAA